MTCDLLRNIELREPREWTPAEWDALAEDAAANVVSLRSIPPEHWTRERAFGVLTAIGRGLIRRHSRELVAKATAALDAIEAARGVGGRAPDAPAGGAK